MSARTCLPAVLLLASGLAQAEDADELPDAAFLEYLGMWDGSDEDWTLFEGEPSRATTVPKERRMTSG